MKMATPEYVPGMPRVVQLKFRPTSHVGRKIIELEFLVGAFNIPRGLARVGS